MIILPVKKSPVKQILVNPERCSFIDTPGNPVCILPCGLRYDIDLSYEQIIQAIRNYKSGDYIL